MKFKSTEISIQFKVWCPIFNRVKHRLFILGSLPELGAWNIYDALEAHPTPGYMEKLSTVCKYRRKYLPISFDITRDRLPWNILPSIDNHTWQVDVIVPAGSSFEWVWLRTGLNRTGVEWERSTKRNRTVGYFSGVIHSIWANSEEVYLQSATFAEITTYINVNDGYTLVLSGSTPTTGLWNLAKAVPATEFPKKSGYWKVHVSFDTLTNLDFQWVIVKEKDFTNVGVMEEVKHSITGRRGWMRVVAPWMLPVAGIVDISIRNDTLDNAYGRTSILVKERQNRKEEITAWINSWNKKYIQAKRQRQLKQSVSEESKTSDRTKVSDITIDPILTRQPAVRSNENLDELIQKTQERIFKESNTERFTKQLNEGYTDKCDTLKGQGQTDVPSDPINSDALNGCIRQKAQELKNARSKKKKDVSRLQDAMDSDAKSADLKQVHFDPSDPSDNEIFSSLEEAISEGTNSTATHTAAEARSDCLSDNEDFCHMSSSMAHFVASDTGFTELPNSWMSSMTNVPRPSPPLTSQLDVPLLSADLDEGFSEADVTLVSTLVKQHAPDSWSLGPAKQALDTGSQTPSKQAFDTLSPGPSKQAFDTLSPGPSKQAFDTLSPGPSKQAFDTLSPGPSKQAFDTLSPGPSKQAFDTLSPGPSKQAFDTLSPGPSKQAFDTLSPGPSKQAFDTLSPGPSKEAFDTVSADPSKQALDTGSPCPAKKALNTWSIGPDIPDALDNCFPFFSMDYDEVLHHVTSIFYKDFIVNMEDRLHLDWLADKVKLEEDYCTNIIGIDNAPKNSILNIGSFVPFSRISEAKNLNPEETLTGRWTRPIAGTAKEPWTIPVWGGYREGTPNSSSYDGCFSQDHEKLCGPSCSLSDARAKAREMEERWGAGLSLTDDPKYDIHEKFIFYRERCAFYDAYETVAEQMDIEDRRAIAREIESTWCQSAVV